MEASPDPVGESQEVENEADARRRGVGKDSGPMPSLDLNQCDAEIWKVLKLRCMDIMVTD